jgi:hypothetical protein
MIHRTVLRTPLPAALQPNGTRRAWLALATTALVGWGLPGCINLQHAEPMAAHLAGGLRLRPGLPDHRPGGALPVGDKPVLWVPMHGLAHAAVSQLVPVPFLSEAIDAVADRAEARSLAWLEAALDPQAAARAGVQRAGLLAPEGSVSSPVLSTYVVAQDCVDDRVRVALVGQLDGSDAKVPPLARYVVHLPTAWLRSDLSATATRRRAAAGMRAEMDQAASDLVDLLQRARAARLTGNGRRADIGSLHLAGSASGGLVSPTHVVAKSAELIEDEGPVLLFRADGLPDIDVLSGGLLFGVHRIARNALHTFKPVGGAG